MFRFSAFMNRVFTEIFYDGRAFSPAGIMVTLAALVIVFAGAIAFLGLRKKWRTERIAAQAEREKARAWYRAMASEASDIIVLREGGRIVLASNALVRILGRNPEDFQDGGYLKLVHPDDLGEAMKLRGRPPPGEAWTAAYRLPHADGHFIWFEARTRGVYDEASGTNIPTRSIDDRKISISRRSNRMRGLCGLGLREFMGSCITPIACTASSVMVIPPMANTN